MSQYATAAHALTWLWDGWESLLPAMFTDRGMWIIANPHRTLYMAFDSTHPATLWAVLPATERYWACFTPILRAFAPADTSTRAVEFTTTRDEGYTACGATLIDLIANMSTRNHADRPIWVRAARHVLDGESAEAQAASLLVGLGGGGDMGAVLLRTPPGSHRIR